MIVHKNEEKSQILKINVLQNKYVIDRNMWIIDEPIFSSKLIVNLFCRRNVKQSFTLGNKNKN